MKYFQAGTGKWEVLLLVVVVFSQFCHHTYGKSIEATLSEVS